MNSVWKKQENEKGFPYYVHDVSKVQQWDNPQFLDILSKLDQYNWIKFAAYRVAFKIRLLQKALYMDIVPLTLISGVFERHRLNSTENTLHLESYDIEAILSDIYFAANKQNNLDIDVDLAVEIMQNFLYNIYDKNREGLVQVIHLKLALCLLCNSNIKDLHYFIFNLCCDHNNCVTRLKIQTILSKISDIVCYLHEDLNFGHHLVNSAVDDCFAKSPGLVGITENAFISWFEGTPQIISWLPTLHRIKKSESVVHSATCSFCKISPIVGLKYHCLKCSRYVQCQKCYLTARVNKAHKITHNMKESFQEDATQEINYGIIKRLCKLLRCSAHHNNSAVMETNSQSEDRCWLSTSNSDSGISSDSSTATSPYSQLQAVIKQLEIQNKELQHLLLLGSNDKRSMKKYLEKHRITVGTQIQKLKILHIHLKDDTCTEKPKIPIESTPMVPNYKTRVTMDTLSPIASSKSLDNLDLFHVKNIVNESSSAIPTINDLSTWIGGKPNFDNSKMNHQKRPVYEMHNDLDEALAKLQQILANNFILDESLGTVDNGELKNAVTEVEGMLTSLIDNVESNKCGNATESDAMYK